MTTVNALRTVAIVGAFAIYGVAGRVMYLYYAAHRIARVQGRPDRGLLARHVWTIAMSHLLLVAGATIELYVRLGEPFTWRLPVYGTALVLSGYALVTLMTYENHAVGLPPPTWQNDLEEVK